MNKIVVSIFLMIGNMLLHAGPIKIDTVRTNDGRVFNKVKIVEVQPDSITIMHKHGGCRLMVEDLSKSLREKLKLSLDEKTLEFRKRRELAERNAERMRLFEDEIKRKERVLFQREQNLLQREQRLLAALENSQKKMKQLESKISELSKKEEKRAEKIAKHQSNQVSNRMIVVREAPRVIRVNHPVYYPHDYRYPAHYPSKCQTKSRSRVTYRDGKFGMVLKTGF